MSTKSEIIKILEENRGVTVSGSILADKLNVSRAAIWKAIKELRREGYNIHAGTNRGYSLSTDSDLLSAEAILLYLRNTSVNISKENIHVYKTLDSTNQLAKKMAVEGAAHGTVVLSEEQTNGRGRLGRSFFSPKGTGIYMSIILRPAGTAETALPVTTAASVAVSRALSQVIGIETQIKWVNDIYLYNRKICGILTEAVSDFETGTIEAVILGIGINYSTPQQNFPDDIKNTAGSVLNQTDNISNVAGTQTILSRSRLAAAVIDNVMTLAEDLDPALYIDEYRAKCFILGKDITVYQGNSRYDAKALDIDSKGGLVVQKSDGTSIVLNSGEVTVRTK